MINYYRLGSRAQVNRSCSRLACLNLLPKLPNKLFKSRVASIDHHLRESLQLRKLQFRAAISPTTTFLVKASCKRISGARPPPSNLKIDANLTFRTATLGFQGPMAQSAILSPLPRQKSRSNTIINLLLDHKRTSTARSVEGVNRENPKHSANRWVAVLSQITYTILNQQRREWRRMPTGSSWKALPPLMGASSKISLNIRSCMTRKTPFCCRS